MQLSDAINEFTSVRSFHRSSKGVHRYDRILRIFCVCMQDPELSSLDLEHIVWYFKELERLGWKRNGINLIAIAVKKFFEYCNLRGYYTFNEQLIPVPRREFNIPRVTDLKSFKKLLAQIPKRTKNSHHLRNRVLLLLLWDTGARVGEILSLDVEDLDLKKCTAIIKTEKSRGRRPIRQIYWTKDTNIALKAWLKSRASLLRHFNFRDPEALFVSIGKSAYLDTRGSRMNDRGVAECLRVLSNQAGLPRVVNAHSVRHSMGRDAQRVLRSDSGVSNILGHSNIESSYIYTMLFGQDLQDEWRRVMRKRGGPMAPTKKQGFPTPKLRVRSVMPGQIEATIIHNKTGRFARS